jgi:aldose 1-epimerase
VWIWDAVVWDAIQIDDQTLELKYVSKTWKKANPGNLTIKVIYQLTVDTMN